MIDLANTNTVSILDKLIGYPTVKGNVAAKTDLLNYVEQYLLKLNMQTWWPDTSAPSLIASTRSKKHAKLILYAHIDVVDASDEMFSLKRTTSKLIGRGTLDMKFALASYLSFLAKNQQVLDELDISVMLVSDEEVAGDSAKKIIEEGFTADVAVIPDGGAGWAFEHGSKGALTFEAIAKGVGAHGSRPWEGDSASDKLLTFLFKVSKLFNTNNSKTDNTLNVSRLATKLPESTKDNPQNRLPDYAAAVLDIRVVDKKNYDDMYSTIHDIAKMHDIDLSLIGDFPSSVHDLNHRLIKPFVELVNAKLGKTPQSILSAGANDSVYFEQNNIPCVVVCPPGGGAHSENEWLDVSGLAMFDQVLSDYIFKVAKHK